MFLTQKPSITETSADDHLDVEISTEKVIRQNFDVIQEIDNVLNDYPEYPYQVAFSIEELRSKLVVHVLNHIPKYCSGISDGQKTVANAKLPYRSKSERLRLDILIRGSILHLLRENADWISRQIQRLDNSVATH